MPTLRGHIYDARTGATLQARVHVLESTGKFRAPPDALLKVGGGPPFFYSDGSFTLDLLCGPADVVVERGHRIPAPCCGRSSYRAPARWRWSCRSNAGSTCRPRAGMPATPISTTTTTSPGPTSGAGLIRRSPISRSRSSAPSSGASFPTPATSTSWADPTGAAATLATGPVLDIGEETRHNRPATGAADGGIGYGHLMLINLARLVEPLSRGAVLVAEGEPDYPPLIDAADEAHRQGGVGDLVPQRSGHGGAPSPRRWASSTPSISSIRSGWTRSGTSGTTC